MSVQPRKPRALKERRVVMFRPSVLTDMPPVEIEVGRAWVQDDGTLRLQLDALTLPWSGELLIRDR